MWLEWIKWPESQEKPNNKKNYTEYKGISKEIKEKLGKEPKWLTKIEERNYNQAFNDAYDPGNKSFNPNELPMNWRLHIKKRPTLLYSGRKGKTTWNLWLPNRHEATWKTIMVKWDNLWQINYQWQVWINNPINNQENPLNTNPALDSNNWNINKSGIWPNGTPYNIRSSWQMWWWNEIDPSSDFGVWWVDIK